jgi:serine protease Do
MMQIRSIRAGGGNSWWLAGIGLLAMLLSGPASGQSAATVEEAALRGTEESVEAAQAVGQARALSAAFRAASERVSPSVVTILVDTDDPEMARTADGQVVPFYEEDGFDNSVGSGVIIHAKGFVLTNSHVVSGATRIIVRLADNREFKVEKIKRDKDSDVAMLLIKNPPSDLQVATLGDSNKVEVGDWVIAIGSPFEYASTVSAGIISGKNRSLKQIRRGKLLQTDAAINPGNSGGPLVNLDGEVIAINTAIASSSGGYQGIGFAIPSNQAKWVLTQLARYGQVRRAYLGVDIRDLRSSDLPQTGLRMNQGGVLVRKINPNSPAANAGLRSGDIIVKFGGTRVRDSRDLQGVVERQEAGTSHAVTYLRNGREGELQVTVQRLRSSSQPKEPASRLDFN